MQIDKSVRNGSMAGSVHEVRERPSGISDSLVPGESFQDRLRKSMHADTAFISAKGPQGAGIQVNRCEQPPSAQEVEVRRIPYSACDKMEINILEGYTLKAKLEKTDEQTRRVYVEMKEDSGSFRAFIFEADHLNRNSSSAMERIAYETAESMQQEYADAQKSDIQ